MKFCKNLQKVISITDPSWTPFWINYKVLKKFIKELLFSADAAGLVSLSALPSDDYVKTCIHSAKQQQGDSTTEYNVVGTIMRPVHHDQRRSQRGRFSTRNDREGGSNRTNYGRVGSNPVEVAFFKLLHAELKKAEYFFDLTTEEFQIREQRLKTGMDIMKEQESSVTNDKWRVMSQAVYHLYRDLLLLETFAIMSYCGFSKILKKQDKVTGYCTCQPFMEMIVNKASFTHYPLVMDMISSCERLHEEVSKMLILEGRRSLSEDERLFLSMIQRFRQQVILESDESQCKQDAELESDDDDGGNGNDPGSTAEMTLSAKSVATKASFAATTLQNLIEQNDFENNTRTQQSNTPEKVAVQGSYDFARLGEAREKLQLPSKRARIS